MTIADAALKVHRALGSGLLESDYQACPAHDLQRIKRLTGSHACSWRAWRSWRFALLVGGAEAFIKLMLVRAALLGQHLRSGR
jgi:hypothetical protein